MPHLDIDPADWPVLNRLLDEALELGPEDRERFLGSLGAERQAMLPRLRELLAHAADTGANPLLGTLPKVDPETAGEGGHPDDRAGVVVGPYRLVRKVAEGGMGAVWLAERTDGLVQRAVALKLPRGAWPREALAERMGREREILATLSHPNIARLYDAGVTEEGQPWLALEYVEGRAIDVYLREEAPDLATRLRLFMQVARAAAHAHARLVVHRDLKPSNVLVTAEGEVRLLDFGIAKLLEPGGTEEASLTRLGERVLTPGYASPEQVSGRPIGVASDVYSLGVLLYEMLTGARPYRLTRESAAALEEAILTTEPARPSEAAADRSLGKALRGDLDTVLLKALKKVPDDRYATASAFAEDVERWLQGRPVAAQPDSRAYRLRKLVLRNRLAVGAAGAVLLAVLAGAGVAVWQARVAIAEKRRAEEVKEFIASIFREADPYVGAGKVPTAIDLLKVAKDRIDKELGTRPALRVELLNIVGASLLNLQDTATAASVVAAAVEEAERSLEPADPRALHARVLLSQVRRFQGRTKEMRAELERVLPSLRESAAAIPEDLVVALKQLAHLEIDEGKFEAAEAAAREAVERSTARLGDHHPQTAASSITLAVAYMFGKKPELALETAEAAVRRATAAAGGNPRHPRVIEARGVHGRALAEAGRVTEAVEELSQAVADASALFGTSAMMVGFFLQNLSRIDVDAGEPGNALVHSERALGILGEHAGRDSYTYAAGLGARASALLAARRAIDALPDLTSAIESLSKAHGPAHERVLLARALRARTLGYLGREREARAEIEDVLSRETATPAGPKAESLLTAGLLDRLAGAHDEALSSQQEALRRLPPGPRQGLLRMRVLTEIGIAQVELGRHAEAAHSLQQAIDLYREVQRNVSPDRADAIVGLGRARMGLAAPGEALPLLEEADAFWREFDPESRWAGEAALWLGRCYAAHGRGPEALEALSRARRILARSPIPTDARLVRLARSP